MVAVESRLCHGAREGSQRGKPRVRVAIPFISCLVPFCFGCWNRFSCFCPWGVAFRISKSNMFCSCLSLNLSVLEIYRTCGVC